VVIKLLRYFLYIIVGYLIYKVIRMGLSESKKFESKSNNKYKYASSGKVNGGEMVKDPMCNTYIPKKNAIKDTIKGETYYFCSRECRDNFANKLKNGNKSNVN
jgi:uncharacterized protein